jgi:hypothetical protein
MNKVRKQIRIQMKYKETMIHNSLNDSDKTAKKKNPLCLPESARALLDVVHPGRRRLPRDALHQLRHVVLRGKLPLGVRERRMSRTEKTLHNPKLKIHTLNHDKKLSSPIFLSLHAPDIASALATV